MAEAELANALYFKLYHALVIKTLLGGPNDAEGARDNI